MNEKYFNNWNYINILKIKVRFVSYVLLSTTFVFIPNRFKNAVNYIDWLKFCVLLLIFKTRENVLFI